MVHVKSRRARDACRHHQASVGRAEGSSRTHAGAQEPGGLPLSRGPRWVPPRLWREWAGLTVPCPLDVGLLGAGSESPPPSNPGLPAGKGRGASTSSNGSGAAGVVGWGGEYKSVGGARGSGSAPPPRGGGRASKGVSLCMKIIVRASAYLRKGARLGDICSKRFELANPSESCGRSGRSGESWRAAYRRLRASVAGARARARGREKVVLACLVEFGGVEQPIGLGGA